MLSFTFLYASFWRRLGAFAIDLLILGLISGLLLQPFLDFLGLRELSEVSRRLPFSVVVLRTYGVWFLMTLLGSWLYFALQESSMKQATLGKRIMGIMVFSSEEERIRFGQASLRFWAKFVSASIALVGFLMALFDTEHRTLHDMLANTQVLQPRAEAFSAPRVGQSA